MGHAGPSLLRWKNNYISHLLHPREDLVIPRPGWIWEPHSPHWGVSLWPITEWQENCCYMTQNKGSLFLGLRCRASKCLVTSLVQRCLGLPVADGVVVWSYVQGSVGDSWHRIVEFLEQGLVVFKIKINKIETAQQ